ncbi:MAG: hypothetical protein JRM82_00050 [Nitrososphaerota archaeon]|nr:hypothetical protein [Nitrososphaerota archaeon]
MWEGGVNLPLSELKEPEVRNRYRKLSWAEEVVEVGSGPHPRAEVKEALVEKRLSSEGKKLAARINTTLKFDYGHDRSLKELELEVFGEGNSEIET